MASAPQKTAILYRMVTPTHTCPYGLKARDLLRRKGYRVDDRLLTNRPDIDAFKTEHGVKTTPQVFIAGERIGGYDDLRTWFGHRPRDADAPSYLPVAAVFGTAAALALAASQAAFGALFTGQALVWAIAFAMALLAMLKLRDVRGFATMFLGYDLLARRWVPYATIYPFAEGLAGVLMAAGVLRWLSIPVALFIGTVGAVSVIKAVYVDRRDLKCACVGGDSHVPLGFISLVENVLMIGMALWMLAA
jgi:glutaredoxin